MLLYGYLLLIGIFSILAVLDWRKGVYLLIALGCLQDPIRKMVPGVPAVLVLATVPVWCAILIGAFTSTSSPWSRFSSSFPSLMKAIGWFLVSLVPAAVISATYGTGSWKLTLVGLFSYFSFVAGMLIGFCFPRKLNDVVRLMAFYCICTSFLLIGTPLDYFGIASGSAVLGTEAFGTEWIRYTGGSYIELYAGFFRSPDVMGWHAAATCMLAATLALAAKTRQRRLFWIAVAIWGGAALLLCGRRKMVLMLPAFALIATWVWTGSTAGVLHRMRGAIAGLAILLVVGLVVYNIVDPEGMGDYYVSTGEEMLGRVKQHGVSALIVTVRQSGFFGEGLGTATQGTHHLQVVRPRTWQEGGVSRVLVELGIPGLICFLAVGAHLAHAVYLIAGRVSRYTGTTLCAVGAGLSGLFMANAGSFLISHQIFGDPYIMALFTFLVGTLLSVRRIGGAVDPMPSAAVGHRAVGSPSLPHALPVVNPAAR